MKCIQTVVLVLSLGFIPTAGYAEIWSYACAEAMTLLSQAQQDVAQSHQQVYQAKLALRIFPDGLDACRSSRRGFAGGIMHCVNHRTHGGVAIKEVMQAERGLAKATREFNSRLKDLQKTCSAHQ